MSTESQTVESTTSRPSLDCELVLTVLERAFHTRQSEWLFFRELRIGTGFHGHAPQRLDAFALNCLPHTGMKRICYEVKISRADLLGELRRPLKRRIGLRYSNEFYFVTLPGLFSLEEIPVECGLIEVGRAVTEESRLLVRSHSGFFYLESDTGLYCQVTVPAPWRETPGPTWQFAAAMLRNQARQFAERPPAPDKQQRLPLE